MFYRLSKREIRELVSSLDDIPDGVKDGMAIPSYLHRNPFVNFLMWRRYKIISDMACLKKEDVVCEFGCGLGLFLPTLCESASKVYAIDLFLGYAERLAEKRKLPVTFVKSLGELDDEAIDVIVAADVMEHLDNPSEYVLLCRQKLKSGGRLIVSGPTETLVYKIGRIIAGFGGMGGYHKTNIDDLRILIGDCGFNLVRTRTLPFRIPPVLFKIFSFQKP